VLLSYSHIALREITVNNLNAYATIKVVHS
jgi:hypothetical protein